LSPNLTHSLNEKAKHLAHIVAYCRDRRIATVEASEAAEAAWVDTIVRLGEPLRQFNASCTPSYLNNEGKQNEISKRNIVYAAGPLLYFDLLKRWRDEGRLSGLELGH
jgi:cyclohexanone monooxygenase